ncbi:TadE family type IV pilus minor pilin [uncultured Corynebacterium sp.]|uniref:TadE family type IV pilus minor pilin n=1 Tax=uncultured Corynebacterium sp. TaxID=159447 RepID=UPI00261D8E8B|nr:TadE family type IV pilus minor pilin [uncultured Corynebacterium sp.]
MTGKVRRRARALAAEESGQATVETAFALSTIIAVLMIALAAIAVVAAHLSATDAAGHLARAHARGDDSAVHAIRQSVGPDARVEARYGDDAVTVTVTMRLAMMDVTGRATALLEDTATR